MSGDGADFEFSKPRRVEDEALLEEVRRQYCAACGVGQAIHPHHVTSRGAGGGDIVSNVMPLCPEHHAHWHSRGIVQTCRNYPGVKRWLENHGRAEVLERAITKRGK